MLGSGDEDRAGDPCVGSGPKPAETPRGDDGDLDSSEDPATLAPKESVGAEVPTKTCESAVVAKIDPQSEEVPDEVDQLTSAKPQETVKTEDLRVCCLCGPAESAAGDDPVLVCSGCGLTVHRRCYTDVLDPANTDTPADNAKAADSSWKCGCCSHAVVARAIMCVYCNQLGDGLMVNIDTSAPSWQSLLALPAGATAMDSSALHFGHAVCARWDPRRTATLLAVEPPTQSKVPTDSTEDTATTPGSTDAVQPPASIPVLDPRSLLLSSECCFCRSSAGVRIQCRRVDCCRFFHVRCAAEDGNGYVELVAAAEMSQYHAYCDRHRSCREDITNFLDKLLMKPVTALSGRDEARRLHTLVKRLSSFTSIEAVLSEIAADLVGRCNKGLRASRSDPPAYNMKHLQVLQLFLDHVPQLEVTYALPRQSAKQRVNDAKLYQQLVKTFNPQRLLNKLPGPLSQQHVCDVCSEPFHERQHVLYCSNTATPHAQHWKCSKRKSTIREREKLGGGSGKKKAKSIAMVSNGSWTDVKLPKGLPSAVDGIICGACRDPIDTRGLIASRKEAKRSEFEKKETTFAHHGCFANGPDPKLSSRSSRAPSPGKGQAGSGSHLPPRPPPKSSSRSADHRLHRRSSGASVTAVQESPKQAHAAQDAASASTAPVVLAPLKMERINVQRTTRWLACVGQIIRLAGARRPREDIKLSPKDDSAPTEANTDKSPGETGRRSNGTSEASNADENATMDDVSAEELNDQPATSKVDQVANGTETPLDGENSKALASSAQPAKSTASTASPSPAAGESVKEPKDAAPTTTDIDASKSEQSTLSVAMQAYFDEALQLVRPFDPYALDRIESAHEMLTNRSGPGVAVLRMLSQEYTRFVHTKHIRAVDRVRNEKRKREQLEAQQQRELERKRIDHEAEVALKKKMLAMRKKQRKLIHQQA